MKHEHAAVTDFSEFSYYDPNATARDGIRGMLKVWQWARLGYSGATTETEHAFYALLQGLTYNTIMELRKLPLKEKLISDTHTPTEEEVRVRRAMIRIVS